MLRTMTPLLSKSWIAKFFVVCLAGVEVFEVVFFCAVGIGFDVWAGVAAVLGAEVECGDGCFVAVCAGFPGVAVVDAVDDFFAGVVRAVGCADPFDVPMALIGCEFFSDLGDRVRSQG